MISNKYPANSDALFAIYPDEHALQDNFVSNLTKLEHAIDVQLTSIRDFNPSAPIIGEGAEIFHRNTFTQAVTGVREDEDELYADGDDGETQVGSDAMDDLAELEDSIEYSR